MQWWIQDFPLGGANPLGGTPMSDASAFGEKRAKMKELGPVGGGGARGDPVV